MVCTTGARTDADADADAIAADVVVLAPTVVVSVVLARTDARAAPVDDELRAAAFDFDCVVVFDTFPFTFARVSPPSRASASSGRRPRHPRHPRRRRPWMLKRQ